MTRVHGAAGKAPALGFEAHPLAADWFAALAHGAEAQFYTPALWQRARIVAVMLSKLLESGRPSSQMYAALQTDMKALLVDAGELQRLGIEVQANEPDTKSNVIDYRARLSARPHPDIHRSRAVRRSAWRSDRLYRACSSMCRRTHPRSGRSRSIPPSPSSSPRAAPAIQDEKCDEDHNEHRHASHQPYFFGDVHLSRIRIPQRPICLRHDRRRPP